MVDGEIRVICGDNIKWLTLSEQKGYPNGSYCRLPFSKQNTLQNYYQRYKNLDILNRLYPTSRILMLCDSLVEIELTIYISEINYDHISTGDNKNRNLLNLLKAVGATQYISGISAKAYMDLKLFEQQEIEVLWNNYQPHDKNTLSCIHYLLADGRQKVLEYLS